MESGANWIARKQTMLATTEDKLYDLCPEWKQLAKLFFLEINTKEAKVMIINCQGLHQVRLTGFL